MKTSNYRISGRDPKAVSIARGAPSWYKGREYKKLSPKPWFLKKYKTDGDTEFYIAHFYQEVLNILNPEKIYAELGENAILLCWEEPGEFCHRHIVSEWLSNSLNIKINEIENPHPLGLKCPELTCRSNNITAYVSIIDEKELGCQCNKCGHTWQQKSTIFRKTEN